MKISGGKYCWRGDKRKIRTLTPMPFKLRYQIFDLPFKYPFTISKGTKTHQQTLIVELEWNGFRGYGEAPVISYYPVTIDQILTDLTQKKTFIEKFAFTEPERYWHYLHHLLPKNPLLVCALDMACWDIYGQLKRQPLYALWSTDISQAPLTDITIGLDSPETMVTKMKENPWPVYKIKLGTDRDLELLKELRNYSGANFRLDVNGGWTANQAKQILPRLDNLNIELVEEPIKKYDYTGMKQLMEISPVPLIADESCVGEEDIKNCFGHFHGINIKLTKCSGITPAIRMIKKARESGLKIMLGNMNESTIGSAALAHLMPQADYADIDGPLLLAEDPGKGLIYNSGKILLSNAPGLGVSLK